MFGKLLKDPRTRKKIFFGSILFVFILIVCAIGIEVFSVILIKKLGYNWEPAYLRIIKGYKPSNLYGGKIETYPWGQWGVPNYNGIIRNNCFDVSYVYNSFGARDKERSMSGKGRTIVLGDSFIEGFGVEQDKTLPAYLEAQSGKEFLNFGVAGGYGPLNYYILYKDFASKFEHENVLVGITIGNDFTDNDPLSWLGNAQLHYFPFWKLTEDKKDFEIEYFSPKRKFVRELDPANEIPEYQYFTSWKDFSAFLKLSEFIRDRKIHFDAISQAQKTSYSLDFSQDQIIATELALARLSDEAASKKRFIAVLPSVPDVQYYLNNKGKKIEKYEAFTKKLEAQGWKVIDALDAFSGIANEDVTKYFIICDGHPSSQGYERMASYIYSHMQ